MIPMSEIIFTWIMKTFRLVIMVSSPFYIIKL